MTVYYGGNQSEKLQSIQVCASCHHGTGCMNLRMHGSTEAACRGCGQVKTVYVCTGYRRLPNA